MESLQHGERRISRSLLTFVIRRVIEHFEVVIVTDAHEVVYDIRVVADVNLGGWVLVGEFHAVLVVVDVKDLNVHIHVAALACLGLFAFSSCWVTANLVCELQAQVGS